MNKSESIKELAAALAKAQSEIKGAVKDSVNPHFRSKYADLQSVWDAIRSALTSNGLSVVQLPEPSDKNEIRLETVLLHSSGEWISGLLVLPVTKPDAQGFGSAMTYARRYGLSAITGVAPEDDDGNAASEKPKPSATAHTPTMGSWESMSGLQQNTLTDIATQVIDYLDQEKDDEAFSLLETVTLSAEEKIALWTRFDSKQRARLKKLNQKEKAA